MLKEEIFALIDQLSIDQEAYDKFYDYVYDFCSRPRCKKGCIEFVNGLYQSGNIEGFNEIAITLLTDKTECNSNKLRNFVFDHSITQGYVKSLKNQRMTIMVALADYVIETAERIRNSELEDKAERQVYLRRAVARLRKLFSYRLQTALTTETWAEVEPDEFIDYLTSTLDELVAPIKDPVRILEWADAWGDYQNLDQKNMLASIRNYPNYLDTFAEY